MHKSVYFVCLQGDRAGTSMDTILLSQHYQYTRRACERATSNTTSTQAFLEGSLIFRGTEISCQYVVYLVPGSKQPTCCSLANIASSALWPFVGDLLSPFLFVCLPSVACFLNFAILVTYFGTLLTPLLKIHRKCCRCGPCFRGSLIFRGIEISSRHQLVAARARWAPSVPLPPCRPPQRSPQAFQIPFTCYGMLWKANVTHHAWQYANFCLFSISV